jgi:6-phosphogluconolactonase
MAYASGYAPNIEIFSVDATSGALAPKGSTASFGSSPSYLAVNPSATTLYALDESSSGAVGAYAIDKTTGSLKFLNSMPSGGAGPAFLSVDHTGKFVLVANYDSATIAVLPVQGDGSVGAALMTLNTGKAPHSIVADPSNKYVFVPCKDSDLIEQYLFDATTGALTPNATPQVMTAAGVGPRHIAFTPDAHFAYVINEMGNSMTAYSFDSSAGTLTEIESQSTLPQGASGGAAAEVWIHPSGAWVLGSNRGDDSIAVFKIDSMTGKMTLAGVTKTGGTTPRDFTFDPSGAFVYAANQDSNSIVPFRFDATQGTLTPVATSVSASAVSFVGIVPLH